VGSGSSLAPRTQLSRRVLSEREYEWDVMVLEETGDSMKWDILNSGCVILI